MMCRGKQGEEIQVAQLPLSDPPVIGATHPKVKKCLRLAFSKFRKENF
jgi:hypothetical protein